MASNQFSSDTSISSDEENVSSRRGVKQGEKRGRYRCVKNADVKRRVLAAVENGDWKSVAIANGVPVQTAYGWLRKGTTTITKKGGSRFCKVQEHHVNRMLEWLSENPLLTLSQLRRKLAEEEQLSVSINTIHKKLDGQCFTLKKVKSEPVTMNSVIDKEKRASYVQSLMAAVGEGKKVIYIDESNVNLFLRRSEGRSRRGTRCCVKAATTRGSNVHIIGGISQTGLVFWERQRGSYTKDKCCEWLRRLLRTLTDQMDNIVIVCDNAPVHADLEKVVEEDEFLGATILRSAPYSAPLNPIEECWSVVKAEMKKMMAESLDSMLLTQPGITQTEHRLRYLENAIDSSMTHVTPMLCMRTWNHVQKHFAGCLARQDLQMGDNV